MALPLGFTTWWQGIRQGVRPGARLLSLRRALPSRAVSSPGDELLAPEDPYGRCVLASLPSRTLYADFRRQSPAWQKAEHHVAGRLSLGIPLLEDLFHLLHEPGAPLNPGVDPRFHWNFAVIATLAACPHFQRLQSQVRGNPLAAALAALRLAEELVAEPALWGPRRKGLRRNGRLKKPSPLFLMGIPLAGEPQEGELYYSIANATRRAACHLNVDAALRSGWGIHPGSRSLHHFDDVWHLLALAREMPWIQELTETLEQLRRLLPAPSRRRRPGDVGRSRVVGYTLGRDLNCIAPEEVVKLADRQLEGLFFEAYDHGRLLQQAYSGQARKGQGPLVCCMDVSRSMNALAAGGRERFLWAKALGLTLLDWARRGDRPFLGLCFSSEHELAAFRQEGPGVDPKVALEMAQCDFNGGTRFEGPLQAALDYVEQKGEREGHVVFITDGEAPLSEGIKERVRAAKSRQDLALVSVFIDGEHAGLRELSDRVFHVRSERADSWERTLLSVTRCLEERAPAF